MSGFIPKVDEQHFFHIENRKGSSSTNPLFVKFPGILFSVGFLHAVEFLWRRLKRCTNPCSYPIALPMDTHKLIQREPQIPVTARPSTTGESTISYKNHTYKETNQSPPQTWRAHRDCKTPVPAKNLNPLKKSQSLPTIRVKFPSEGEGNARTRGAARKNHRKEAEVRIKVLCFFNYKKKKKETYLEEVQIQRNRTCTI